MFIVIDALKHEWFDEIHMGQPGQDVSCLTSAEPLQEVKSEQDDKQPMEAGGLGVMNIIEDDLEEPAWLSDFPQPFHCQLVQLSGVERIPSVKTTYVTMPCGERLAVIDEDPNFKTRHLFFTVTYCFFFSNDAMG